MLRQNWGLVAAIIVCLLIFAYGQRAGVPAETRELGEKTEQLDVEAEVICLAVNRMNLQLRDYILAQIHRSKRSIPTIVYYKNHPVELGRALANLNQQESETKAAFAPTNCRRESS